MKNFLINIVAKYLGVGKLLGFLDGKKAYLGGGGLILAGAGMILVDLAPVLATKDISALIAFGSSVPAHPGFTKLMEGLGIVGLRHAASKNVEQPKP